MPITDWPRADQPREKLLTKGDSALTDAELIAILLRTGTRGQHALDIAQTLLRQYGCLKKIMRAPSAEIIQFAGIGRAKYAGLRAALEFGKRYLQEPLLIGEVLKSSQLTQKFLAERLRENVNEVFACLYLDNHFRILAFEELFHGTINEANIYPREIVRRGLLHNAAKIILAHNHPSGSAEPSAADRDVTQIIKQTLALVDIDVIDHIIVGNPALFSFAENGLI